MEKKEGGRREGRGKEKEKGRRKEENKGTRWQEGGSFDGRGPR